MRGSQQAKLSSPPRGKAVIQRRLPTTLVDFSGGAAIWPLTGLTLAGWLAFSGALLAARATLGAIQPLSWRQLLLAVSTLLVAGFISHAVVARPTGGLNRSKSVLICNVLTTGGLLFWAIALLLAAGSRPLAGALCLAPIAAETWAWRNFASRHRRKHAPVAAALHAPAPQLVQQFTRTLTAAGEEIIEGRVAVRFEPGGRMAAAHIAFCPPFIQRPRFEAKLIGHSSGTLKVTQVYAHGARVEVRMPKAADSDRGFLVRFTARAPRMRSENRFAGSPSVSYQLQRGP